MEAGAVTTTERLGPVPFHWLMRPRRPFFTDLGAAPLAAVRSVLTPSRPRRLFHREGGREAANMVPKKSADLACELAHQRLMMAERRLLIAEQRAREAQTETEDAKDQERNLFAELLAAPGGDARAQVFQAIAKAKGAQYFAGKRLERAKAEVEEAKRSLKEERERQLAESVALTPGTEAPERPDKYTIVDEKRALDAASKKCLEFFENKPFDEQLSIKRKNRITKNYLFKYVCYECHLHISPTGWRDRIWKELIKQFRVLEEPGAPNRPPPKADKAEP